MRTSLYDEMRTENGSVRDHCQFSAAWLSRTGEDRIKKKRGEAERELHRLGITFAIYGEDSATEPLIPLDIILRIMPASEWQTLEPGLPANPNVPASACWPPRSSPPEGAEHSDALG